MKVIKNKGLFAMLGENEKIPVFVDNSAKYRSALEEIREIASPHCSQCREIINKINEVLK